MSDQTLRAPRTSRSATALVAHLVGREFQLRYRRSVIGWIWSIAQPLLRFIVLAYVFTRVIPVGTIPNYPAFLFIGLVAWMWFGAGVLSATSSVLMRRELLMRPGVPRTMAPVVSVLADMIDFVTALPIVFGFLIYSGSVSPYVLLLPVLMALQFLLILGIGMALCSANVYVRDVRLFTEVALLLGFYVTPVFYHQSSLPSSAKFFYTWNPVSRLLEAYRDILIYHRFPQQGSFLIVAAFAFGSYLLGIAIYRRTSVRFLDEI
jgi:lipopolysaccharide transport system permease protein